MKARKLDLMERNKLVIIGLLVSAFLIGSGFHTINTMINTFAWSPPLNSHDPVWNLNTWLRVDFWWSSHLFGYLPLIVGCIVFGWLLHEVYEWERI